MAIPRLTNGAGNLTGDTVTVLIPAYNAAAFLHRAVNSALNQTLPVHEILIVDDASTDDTVEAAERLRAADARVRIVGLKENGGPAKARNAGLDAARGDWIAMLDADDAFLPERLERMISAGREAEADIVADNFAWYNALTETIGDPGIALADETEIVTIRRFVAQARPFSGEADWGLLKPVFRREFLERHNLRYPTFSRHGEDFLFMLNVFLAGARHVLIRQVGYLYTDRSSGMSRTQIDYDTMAIHTMSLLKDERVRNDKGLRRVLYRRAVSIRRLAAEYRLRPYIDRRHVKPIIHLALSDPYAFRTVLRFGARKIKSWMK
jgi:succinoglycan biosynthesis protein ExoO